MPVPPKILVLAGRRSSTLDPMAEAHGVSHKCVVPVAGVPMIERVFRAVDEAYPDAPVFVSIEDPAIIENLPTVRKLRGQARLETVDAQHNIVDSVTQASRTSGFPLIITTADNVLMTAESLHRLADEGSRSGSGRAGGGGGKAGHPSGASRWAAPLLRIQGRRLFKLQHVLARQPARARRRRSLSRGRAVREEAGADHQGLRILNLLRFRMGRHSIARMFEFISRGSRSMSAR
jgi:CTP:molybdopterin cytidylyltransferase MocA